MARVATIIVTYNGSQWIRRCLEHLLHSSVASHIIILDNKSTDDTIEILKSFLENIELIKLSSNLGFGGANNIGIQRALELGYSHIFLLNQMLTYSRTVFQNYFLQPYSVLNMVY